MNKRPLDKTKKTNIKCEHCQHWNETGYYTPYGHYPIKGCFCKKSKWNGRERNYWNRCKCFEWHKKYDKQTEEGGE